MQDLIRHKEPITRGGGGKAHWVEFLYRTPGEQVYVNRRYRNGLTRQELEGLMKRNRGIKMNQFRVMQRGMRVFAKGRISHPDHYTLELPCWCEVVMNREERSKNLVFLD